MLKLAVMLADWRGYVWGPMAQLVYWSLLEYDHVPIVRTARKALTVQMEALLLTQWRDKRHICENFSPKKPPAGSWAKFDCTGTKMYHWGALTGLIGVVEGGHFLGQGPSVAKGAH